jgi:hypothetical protein
VQHTIPSLVAKTMDHYVMPALESCVTTIGSFDLWMYRSGHDTFALVINFINPKWAPYYVIVGLFETINIAGVTMATQVKDLIYFYSLCEVDCMCEGQRWQSIHSCTCSQLCGFMCPFGTCNSLARELFWPCFQQSMLVCL